MPELHLPFDSPQAWACGQSTSLYDVVPSTSGGVRAGDPIADCFAIVSYENHTLLAVADGVNWGEPAKRAARSAVLGTVAHLHKALPAMASAAGSSGGTETSHVFTHMIDALQPAQKLILAQCGTLTTLVLTVVARLAVPIKKGSLRPSTSTSSTTPRYHWAAMTVTVGDSSAFLYRQQEDLVEELTYAAHAGAYRDPRWTPGALGYAAGEEPDLSNLTCSLTLLSDGDLVFLTSDGVADNFDPFILKQARQAIEGPQWGTTEGASDDGEDARADDRPPVMDSEQSHARKVQLLADAVRARRSSSCSAGQGAGEPSAAAGQQQVVGSPPLSSSPLAGGGFGVGRFGRALSRAGSTAASAQGLLSAQSLVQGLLEHVMQETAEQRRWAERKHMAKEAENRRRAQGLERELPSLSTDTRGSSARDPQPPGKMDHATVAAYQAGG